MKSIITSLVVCSFLLSACGRTDDDNMLRICEQGSFLVGGSVITVPGSYDENNSTNPAGQTLHGDHAYVFYQIPEKTHSLPLVFLHGNGESAKTWETTPDGREGFQNIFLRRGFSVYLADQPRRGKAGKSTVSDTLRAVPDEAFQFEIFRVGVWPDPFPGVQFSPAPQAWEQFMRQVTPNTGAFDKEVVSDALSALMDKIGGGILITHSMGGGPGWLTAIKSSNTRAVIAYEPGSSFIFPKGEVPSPDSPQRTGKGFGSRFHIYGQVSEVDTYSYRHLLWRQHSRTTYQALGTGHVACPPRNGASFRRLHQPPRRGCTGNSLTRLRH